MQYSNLTHAVDFFQIFRVAIALLVMSRLIVVVGADRRQGGSVIDALLEHPDEWRVRAINVDPTSLNMQVLKRKEKAIFSLCSRDLF
jgi:hypothetical protein